MTTHLTDAKKSQIRIALAKWIGLRTFFRKPEFCNGCGSQGWQHKANCRHIPNYPASLDCCHAIEVKLTDEQYKAFHNTLYILTSADDAETLTEEHRRITSASVEHRALALFRALNLGELGD